MSASAAIADSQLRQAYRRAGTPLVSHRDSAISRRTIMN